MSIENDEIQSLHGKCDSIVIYLSLYPSIYTSVLLVKGGAVSAIMNSLVDKSRCQYTLEQLISHLVLLNKFSSRGTHIWTNTALFKSCFSLCHFNLTIVRKKFFVMER